MKVIIFEVSGKVKVLYPSDCGLSVPDIGKKDVPAETPFWIVEHNSISGSPFDTLKINSNILGEAAGLGGTYFKTE